MADITLDCKQLNCPMPIVKIAKAIRTMDTGQTLEVTATDPAFQADIEAWSRKTGNKILSFSDEPSFKKALLEKTQ